MNIDMLFRFNDLRFVKKNPLGCHKLFCVGYYRLIRHEDQLVWWHHRSSYDRDSFEEAISKFPPELNAGDLPIYPQILERDEATPITFLAYDDYPL